MFTVTDVPLVLRTLKLAIAEDDDGERERLCHSTFRLGLLSLDMARTIIGMPVARHCFGVDDLPLWEIGDVWFTPPEGKYQIALKSAIDMPEPAAVLENATLEKFRVWRPKADHRDLIAELVIKHSLERANLKDLADLLTVWEAGRSYVTFTEIRPPLLAEVDAPQPRSSKRTH